MADEPNFDASTITPIEGNPAAAKRQPRPTLTVLWHTDVDRVGERARLEGPEVRIGRNQPLFAMPGLRPVRQLADTCMSRDAALTLRFSDDSIELEPHASKVPIAVQGEALTTVRTLPIALLDEGVVISFGDRVALCLHLGVPRPTRAPDLGMVGQSDGLEALRRDIVRVARTDLPVLIRGETGTGKELVAKAIVAQSRRSGRPFIALDMGRMAAATAAAELFGHERGAFTGAVEARAGFFAQADGGTLFLDELGNMFPDVQAMLLRAVEAGEVVPLGSTRRARPVDVRLIAATDADLEARVRDGRFSQPLYRRLAKAEIRIPPVRQRRPDIGVLLLHCLRKVLSPADANEILRNRGVEQPWLSARVVARLALHDWSGNVRELETYATRLVLASEGETCAQVDEVAHLIGDRIPAKRATRAAGDPIAGISDEEFQRVFEAKHYVAAAVARALRIARTTVYDLMARNGIRKSDEIPDDEILGTVDACGGSVRKAAARLRVSHYALTARLASIAPQPQTPAPLPRRRAAR